MEGSNGFNTQVPNNLHFIISAAGTAKMAKKDLKYRKGTLNSFLYKTKHQIGPELCILSDLV